MWVAMSAAERDEFLAGVHVGILSAAVGQAGAEGPVVSEEEVDVAERLAMARRYLGATGGDRYLADNPDPERQNVAFRMRPEHWLSQDQGKGQAAE
jgi:hypothetical protein